MTRSLTIKPNGDPPGDQTIDVALPGKEARYQVIFLAGEPWYVTSQFYRRCVRYDWAGRVKHAWSSCVTKTLWYQWRGNNPSPLAAKVIDKAQQIRAERHPILQRVARHIDVDCDLDA